MPADLNPDVNSADVNIVDFILPDLGEGLEEAEIVRWLVPEGAEVTRDQPFVEVETDKSVVELPSPVTGRLGAHGAPAGGVVLVGSVLARFEQAGGVGTTSVTSQLAAPTAQPEAYPAAGAPADTPPTSQRPRPLASPTVRRLATDLGIDLADVAGTGPGGRVLADDLHAFSPESAAHESVEHDRLSPSNGAAPEGQSIKVRGVRKATAVLTAQSWSTIPHVTQMDLVDVTEVLALRERSKAANGGRGLGVLPFAVMASARALRRFPMVNATFDSEGLVIRQHGAVNIAVAISTDDGVIVPVIRDADTLDLASIASQVERFVDVARSRTVKPEEMRDATFTITNYGVYGGGFGLPLIRPPEVGILGLGAIKKRPMVVGDEVVARSTIPCVFAADHRVIDGDVLIGFFEAVTTALADPISMLVTRPIYP